jgi:hypothetical protein
MTTKNNDPSPRGREWETLVTKHRELNDLLGAFDDLPDCPDEMSSTQVASLVNRMYDFHHGPLIGANWMLDIVTSHAAYDALPGSSSIDKNETEGAPYATRRDS